MHKALHLRDGIKDWVSRKETGGVLTSTDECRYINKRPQELHWNCKQRQITTLSKSIGTISTERKAAKTIKLKENNYMDLKIDKHDIAHKKILTRLWKGNLVRETEFLIKAQSTAKTTNYIKSKVDTEQQV